MSSKRRRKLENYLTLKLRWDDARLVCTVEYWSTWDPTTNTFKYYKSKPEVKGGPVMHVKQRMWMGHLNVHWWKMFHYSKSDIARTITPRDNKQLDRTFDKATKMNKIQAYMMKYPLFTIESISKKTLEPVPHGRTCTCKWVLDTKTMKTFVQGLGTEKSVLAEFDPRHVPLVPVADLVVKDHVESHGLHRVNILMRKPIVYKGYYFVPLYTIEGHVYGERVVTKKQWDNLGALVPPRTPIHTRRIYKFKTNLWIASGEGCFFPMVK